MLTAIVDNVAVKSVLCTVMVTMTDPEGRVSLSRSIPLSVPEAADNRSICLLAKATFRLSLESLGYVINDRMGLTAEVVS